jgi:hypothetical protein
MKVHVRTTARLDLLRAEPDKPEATILLAAQQPTLRRRS